MEEKLDIMLDPVLSFRRTAMGPAKKLAQFDDKVQEFVLHRVEIAAATNAEMAFQFADFFDQAYDYLNADLDIIHPFCITIDEQARDYLPYMYGAANYAVIDEVSQLPLKVSEIYRKITSK